MPSLYSYTVVGEIRSLIFFLKFYHCDQLKCYHDLSFHILLGWDMRPGWRGQGNLENCLFFDDTNKWCSVNLCSVKKLEEDDDMYDDDDDGMVFWTGKYWMGTVFHFVLLLCSVYCTYMLSFSISYIFHGKTMDIFCMVYFKTRLDF